jgi:hypothetical protein
MSLGPRCPKHTSAHCVRDVGDERQDRWCWPQATHRGVVGHRPLIARLNSGISSNSLPVDSRLGSFQSLAQGGGPVTDSVTQYGSAIGKWSKLKINTVTKNNDDKVV